MAWERLAVRLRLRPVRHYAELLQEGQVIRPDHGALSKRLRCRARKKCGNLLVDEALCSLITASSRNVAPKRRNGGQVDVRYEPCLVARVGDRKVQVCLDRHV